MLAFLYAPQIRYERSRVLGETLDDRSNITAENSVKAISPSHDCDGQRRIFSVRVPSRERSVSARAGDVTVLHAADKSYVRSATFPENLRA